MKKVYESTGNIHIPELKCSAQKGTRIIVDEDKFTMNGMTVPLPQDFQILLKYNLVRELSDEEIEKPEEIEVTHTLRSAERQRMRVEVAEDNKIEIRSSRPVSLDKPEEEPEESEDSKIRGMKVVTDESIPIAKTLKEEPGTEDVKTSVDVKQKPRPAPKPKKSDLSAEEKKLAAEKLKAERVSKSKKIN